MKKDIEPPKDFETVLRSAIAGIMDGCEFNGLTVVHDRAREAALSAHSSLNAIVQRGCDGQR